MDAGSIKQRKQTSQESMDSFTDFWRNMEADSSPDKHSDASPLRVVTREQRAFSMPKSIMKSRGLGQEKSKEKVGFAINLTSTVDLNKVPNEEAEVKLKFDDTTEKLYRIKGRDRYIHQSQTFTRRRAKQHPLFSKKMKIRRNYP